MKYFHNKTRIAGRLRVSAGRERYRGHDKRAALAALAIPLLSAMLLTLAAPAHPSRGIPVTRWVSPDGRKPITYRQYAASRPRMKTALKEMPVPRTPDQGGRSASRLTEGPGAQEQRDRPRHVFC